MSTGKHDVIPDKALTEKHVDQAILRLLEKVDINRDYWVPYLAGYCDKGWTERPRVFIDQRLPMTLVVEGREMKITRYLLIHECVEKCLMHDLGMPYLLAHSLATAAEKSAVEADGFGWEGYTAALKPWIAEAMKQPEGVPSPPDFDKKPYIQERDHVLEKMR